MSEADVSEEAPSEEEDAFAEPPSAGPPPTRTVPLEPPRSEGPVGVADAGYRSYALAALAGALIAAAGAPVELSFPAFLAPAALLGALEPRRRHLVSRWHALALGVVMGTVVQSLCMYWVVGLLMDFAGFPLIAALPVGALLWLAQSLPYAAGALLGAELMRHRAPGWLALPAALTLAASLSPVVFPWRYGLSQLPFLEYAQVADLGGLPLLDWLVATVGCGLLDALRHRRRAAMAIAVAALVLPPLYGLVRLPQIRAEREAGRALAVGVVQPNIGIHDKRDFRQHITQLRQLRASTAALERDGAELVLWPETAYPFPVHRSIGRDREGIVGLHRDEVSGPMLVGVVSAGGSTATGVALNERGGVIGRFELGTGERYNSALAIDETGAVVGLVDKVHLLVFGEYTPFWDLIGWLHVFPRGLSAGVGPQLVTVAGARIGVLNCYEDLLPGYVRSQARQAPDFLANLTNDAWFGDTNAPHLHHMNARIRSIETRRDLVRAVNTGISGHTAATGEDLARTRAFEPAAFIADVRLLRGRTVWVAVGDWVTPLLAAAILAFVWGRRSHRAA